MLFKEKTLRKDFQEGIRLERGLKGLEDDMLNGCPISSRDKTQHDGTPPENSGRSLLVGRYGFNQVVPSNHDGIVG